MHTRRLLSLVPLVPLGLVLATALPSRAEAQRRTSVVVCRDGTRINSDDSRVCDRRGGIDARATEDARRSEADRVANGRRRGGQANDPRYDQPGDPRYDGRGNGNNGRNDRGQYDDRYGSGRNVVYEWQGTVDKEIQIQLRGNRAFVQAIGAGDQRSGHGRVVNGLPQQSGTLVVERLAGRGDVDVIAQPSARNGYTATLRVRDNRGGADNYRIVAYWQSSGDGRYDGRRYGRN
jgi:hypothetical protein